MRSIRWFIAGCITAAAVCAILPFAAANACEANGVCRSDYACDPQSASSPCTPLSEFSATLQLLSDDALVISNVVSVESFYSGANLSVAVPSSPQTWANLSAPISWHYMHGTASFSPPAINAGEPNIRSSTVIPVSRIHAVSWVDPLSGDLMLFGGIDASSTSDYGDLFRFHRETNEWEMMQMPRLRSLGTRLEASAATYPGPRYAACSAVDPISGLAYLHGGYGGVGFGDLYSYNSSSNQFAYLGGPTSAVAAAAATVGQSFAGNSASNFAGSRDSHACWFTAGSFVIAGGESTAGYRQDVWSYHIATDTWTFVAGFNGADLPASLFAIANNQPLSFAYCGYAGPWFNASDPSAIYPLYLMHGDGVDNTGFSGYSDSLWQLDFTPGTPPTAVWTLLKGDGTAFANYALPAQIGTQGVASASNMPPPRGYQILQLDPSQEGQGRTLVLFGGKAMISGSLRVVDDLWTFDTVDKQWTWVDGNATSAAAEPAWPSSYARDPLTSRPAGRYLANAWADHSGALWVGMGGSLTAAIPGGFALNDLWRTAPLGTLRVNLTANAALVVAPPVLAAIEPSAAWLWKSGSNMLDFVGGNYAAPTGPSATVKPPAVYEAEAWVDPRNGDLYQYGGSKTSGISVPESTLFRFHRSLSQWEVVRAAGATNQGTSRRVADATTHPGPRFQACSAVDPVTGIVYLHGGVTGVAAISGELYSYDSSTNEFTFLSGPSSNTNPDGTASAGDFRDGSTLGDFAGSRYAHSCWFARGHFVMAGGLAFGLTVHQEVFTATGAAVAASAAAAGQPVAFRLAATAGPFFDAANPTARQSMFMFGGQHIGTNAADSYSDALWKLTFEPNSNPALAPKAAWLLMSGNGQIPDTSPTMLQYTGPIRSFIRPSARGSPAMAMDPSDGRTLVLFGGDAHFPDLGAGESNELWTFDTVTELWKFVSGTVSSTFLTVTTSFYPSAYGADSTSVRPYRRLAHNVLIDLTSAVWIANGFYASNPGPKMYSDLWKLGPLTDEQLMCNPGLSENTVSIYSTIASLSPTTPWWWVGGMNVNDFPGSNFATVGWRNSGVQPPGVAGAFQWIDPVSGDPFRYGGRIVGGTVQSSLYRYYRGTDEWKLMRAPGAANQGVTRRVADPTVHPGPVAYGCTVVDHASKIVFFFGGNDGTSSVGEIHSYDSVTNLFTFHSGSRYTNVDGTIAVGQSRDGSTPGNFIGSKTESACWFSRGSLIIAGGYLIDGSVTQDLWSYDVQHDRWWLVLGFPLAGNPDAMAVSAIAATPPQPIPHGGAGYAGPFYDASNPTANNPMYMQGGWANGPTTEWHGDAFWRLDFTPGSDPITTPTALWTCLFGTCDGPILTATAGQVAQYGTPGVASPTNWPTARYGPSMCMDPTVAGAGRYIVLFGGDGFAPPSLDWTLDDLWRFDTVTGHWTFLSGHISGELTDSAWPTSYMQDSTTMRPSKRSTHTLLIDYDSQVWIIAGQNLQNSDSKYLYSDVWRTGPVYAEKPCSPLLVPGVIELPLLEANKTMKLLTRSASQSMSMSIFSVKAAAAGTPTQPQNPEEPAETPDSVVTIPLSSASDPDPCSTRANPCLNGAGCSSRVVAAGLGFEAQVRCLCPDGFFTATCAVGIVECAQCVASYIGGSTIRLRAVGLDSTVRRLRLAEIPITAFNTTSGSTGQVRTITRSLLATTAGIDELVFIAPAIPLMDNSTVDPVTGIRYSSYQTLEVTLALNVSGSSTLRLFAYNLTGYIFATASSCVNEGEWKPTPSGGCEACPRGAYCPGASRAWPLADHWSVNEWLAPRRCPLPGTCVATKRIGSMQAVVGSDGQPALVKKTDNCVQGYTDLECVRCADDHYQLDGRCYLCPSLETQKLQLALVLFAAGVVVLMLSLAISFLSGNTLSVLTMLFVLFQRVTALGSAGARELLQNAKEVATLFSLLNVVNFNVEIVNPGCAVRALNWIGLFWATMLIVAITYVCFMAAAFLRYRINLSRQAKQGGQIGVNAVSPAEDFRRRRIHVTIIAGSLFYLKVVTLQVSGFLCASAPSRDSRAWIGPQAEGMEPQTSNFIRADWETVCWADAHAGTMSFILFSLLTFTVGFPVWVTLTLRRSFGRGGSTVAPLAAGSTASKAAAEDDERALARSRLDTYGVMFRGLRPSLWWFKVTQFPVSVWFAIVVGLLRNDVPLQLFLLGLSAAVQSILAISLMPFERRRANALLVGTAMGTLAYVILLMLVQPGSVPFTVWILIALLAGCAIGLLVRVLKGIAEGSESAAFGGEQDQQGQSPLKQIKVGSTHSDDDGGSPHKHASMPSPKHAFVEMTLLPSPSAVNAPTGASATASAAASPTAVPPPRSPVNREAGEGHVWGLKPAEEQHGHVWGVKSSEAGAVKRTQTKLQPKSQSSGSLVADSDAAASAQPAAAGSSAPTADVVVAEDVN